MQTPTPALEYLKVDAFPYIPVASTKTNIPAAPVASFRGVKCTATIGIEFPVLFLTSDPSVLVVAVELCLDRESASKVSALNASPVGVVGGEVVNRIEVGWQLLNAFCSDLRDRESMLEKVCVRRGKMRCEESGRSTIGKSALAASEQNWIRPESGDTRIYFQVRWMG